MARLFLDVFRFFVEFLILPALFLLALYRRKKLKTKIGLGPEPLINNVYHKKAIELYGRQAETFVSSCFFITNDFDIDLSSRFDKKTLYGKLRIFISLVNLSFKYKALYFYFNGGPIGFATKFLWRVEPFLYKTAGVKTIVMPYGGDVHELTRTKNLYFKHTMSCDYPQHRLRRGTISSKIDLWTKHADHVISGCDWVEYMYYWDTLLPAHFSIDTQKVRHEDEPLNLSDDTLRVFHAPNHKSIKGTSHLIRAIDELRNDGFNIELVTLTGVSNSEVLETIKTADIVADQFVVGWYAMFALESMALKKPVMCFIDDGLLDLYVSAGLLEEGELPIINTKVSQIKTNLQWAFENKEQLRFIGQKSRIYVEKHHSLQRIGSEFERINAGFFG